MKKTLALGVWLAALCLRAGTVNLAVNPGFEKISAPGKPEGWDLRQAYTLSEEKPHGGKYCLRYENHDAARYLLCGRPVALQPGKCYRISAWVRTEGVEGKDNGATLCVEWSDAQGKYLGGCYPKGIKGTSGGWKEVSGLTSAIPTNAAKIHLACYLRKGMTGTAWWDDLEVTEYVPPLVSALTTDCYRNQTAGGPVRVLAGLALTSASLKPSDVTVELRLKDSAGATLQSLPPKEVTADQATFVLDTASLKPGKYEMVCDAKSRDGQGQGTATAKLSRLTEIPRRKAYIDAHQRLILDGAPFFPLGMYWSGKEKDSHLDTYAQSPFNCVMPYVMLTREDLDVFHKRRLKVIYSVKDLYYQEGKTSKHVPSRAEERPAIAAKVKAVQDHPAIIAWYINDELPIAMVDQLSAHRDWLEELDPERPTWAVIYQVDQVRQYLPTFDIIGTDPYPIPTQPASRALDWTRKSVGGTFGVRAVWMVPQVFNWASYHHGPGDTGKQRPPTLAEMRSMAWQCIAGGANGLIFYSWFDLWRMDAGVQGPNGLIRDPFEARWKEVCQMGEEIKRLTPILLSIEPPRKVARFDGPAGVAWRAWGKDGETWLAVANSAAEATKAELEFEAPIKAAHAEMGAPAQTAGRTLRFDLGPLDARMVRVQF